MMLTVAFVALNSGLGFEALRHPSFFLDFAIRLLALSTLALATAASIIGWPAARRAWLGYAVFGWALLLFDVTWRTHGLLPSFWTDQLVNQLGLYFEGADQLPDDGFTQDPVSLIRYNVIGTLCQVAFSTLGAAVVSFLPRKGDGERTP